MGSKIDINMKAKKKKKNGNIVLKTTGTAIGS
jgi:hypothetical protein